jgi:hypothetical protein
VLATSAEIPAHDTIMIIDSDDKIFFGEDRPPVRPGPADLVAVIVGC